MVPADEFPHDDEHKPVETEGEWVSSEPPVDDFGDPTSEAAATVSEDQGHTDMHDDHADLTPIKKSKTPLILLSGAVGILLVAGVFAVIHFMSHNDDEVSMLDMAEQNVAPAPHFEMKPAETPAPAVATTIPVVPSSPPPAASDVAPTTSYSVPSTTPEKTPAAMPSPAPAPTSDSAPASLAAADTAALDAAASVATAPAPAPAPVTPAAQPQTLAQALSQPTPAANAANDARMAAMQARIDELQKSLNNSNQQLTEMTEKLATATAPVIAPAPVAVSVQPDANAEERIKQLEQKLMQAEERAAAASTAKKPAPMDNVFPVTKPAPHKTQHVAEKKMTHKKSVTKSVAAEKGQWILRAATPGEAWVAKDSTTRELRPIHVGDVLAGVGTVRDIRQSGGGWVLVGSAGSIRQ